MTPREAIRAFLDDGESIPSIAARLDVRATRGQRIVLFEWLIRGYGIGLRVAANGKPEPEEDDE